MTIPESVTITDPAASDQPLQPPQRRPFVFTQSPAVIALLIQLAVFGFLALILAIALHVFQFRLGLMPALCAQALLVLLCTHRARLAWWWCVIQPLFPFVLALSLLATWQIPSWLYLAAFLVLLTLYWSTYRTQVPYYPSNRQAWLALEKLLPDDRTIHLVDIGSGLGGLILHLAQKYPQSRFTGIEIAPLPWLISRLRLGPATRNAQFLRNNYEQFNFAEFDVVFAYLSPAAMPALWAKAKSEMRAGSILVSYEFPIVGETEHLSIYPHDSLMNHQKLYVWYL